MRAGAAWRTAWSRQASRRCASSARGGSHAAIGPGAGACCYEVGDEVARAFAGLPRSGRKLDLKAIARARSCDEAGVDEVHDVGLCTICSTRSCFFSHRRDGGVTGRQAGLAWRS